MLKPVEELKVRITASTLLPEPTNIVSTGDWYYLDHVSSGLTGYDNEKKIFAPIYAESWEVKPDGTHVFKIKKDLKFHEGTPLTAKDIVWSIKRHLILRTSTHFPLWDYLVGCENVKTLTDTCDGLKEGPDHDVIIKLKMQTDSFFLQLASPETGIWWAGDMDIKTAALKPTKFSGAYYLESRTDDYALLKRNEFSPISQKFMNSPRIIKIKRIPNTDLTKAMMSKDVDLLIKQYSPYSETDWEKSGVKTAATTPSSIIYLFGLGNKTRVDVGQDLLQAFWKSNIDKIITPAETFLPFAADYSLSKSEFLGELPAKSARKIRILCPDGFFSQKFLDQFKTAALSLGTEIEFSMAGMKEFFEAFGDLKATEKYDYIMSLYVASERYPAVQLRYMTKNLLTPPIDLKQTETPDLDVDRKEILKSYQKWLLKSKQAIPLFFDVTLFVHQNNLDLGNQSMSDGEIELWRVQEKH
ncbi:MAG: ABC transporter substrate-binding protein [Bdellovibrionota bacterium]